MKTYFTRIWILSTVNFALLWMAAAAERTWTGAGGNDFWSTPANWGGSAVSPGDVLLFGGSVRTSPNNDFPGGTGFSGITFLSPAAPFTLLGNGITLDGDIVDSQPLVPQTINLSLSLSASRTVDVNDGAQLTLGGIVSGAGGAGLVKVGGGRLILSGANTFTGPLSISGGSVSISADNNLGTPPGAPTAGHVALDSGTLRATASLTLNANRGITLGIDGTGTIEVVQNSRINMGNYTAPPYTGANTIGYAGSITGGSLIKRGFGGLTLSSAHSYSGQTLVNVGTLRLDFSGASAPVNNILPASTHLTLGGENAVFTGAGAQSFAALVLSGKDGVVNSQSLNGTFNSIGQTYIRLNNGNNGTVNLDLGELTHDAGGGVIFVLPDNGRITTSTANDASGIIGGWATISTNAAPIQNGTIIMSQSLASRDPNGVIVPYSGHTVYTLADDAANVNLNSSAFTGKNVLLVGGNNHAATVAQVDAPNAGTLTDVNTITFSGMRNDHGNTAVPSDGIFIGAGNTLRLGRYGAVYRQDAALGVGNVQINVFIGGPGDAPQQGQGTVGAQNVGTLTAGGADNTPGEIVLHVNNHNQTTGRMNVQAKIADNGSGPVSVIKTGPGGLKINGHNTYSGGTYVIQGLIQLTGSEAGGTANPDGLGVGPVYIFNGGRVSLALGINPQDYYIAGVGTDQENFGAIIAQNGSIHTGKLTLIGDARVARSGNAAGVTLAGQITDSGEGFSFELGNGGTTDNITLSNITANLNDWSGNTIIGRGRTSLAANEQIPDGLGKGNVLLNSDGGAGNNSILNLNGFSETINGLGTSGNAANANIFVDNQAASTIATLTLGNDDQSAAFRGVLRDNGGTLALTKIGRGKQILTGANAYTGITTVSNGTLAVSGAGTISSSSQINVYGGALDVSEVTGGFTYASAINVENGAVIIRNTAAPGITALNLSDARVGVASLGATPVVAEVTTLGTGGTANFVDISTVGTINSYPATFTIIKYAGTIGGSGFNFQLGNVPTPSTVGYLTNNEANSSVDLVLLDGPKPLTWSGLLGPAWDIDNTANWLAFGTTPSVYLDVDSVRFVDGSLSPTVNLTTTLRPGAVVVDNGVQTYTFSGTGKITGPTALTKEGTGTLVLANSGTNDFFGSLSINNGIVQMGDGGTTGNLSGGNVVNNSRLVFNRSDNAAVGNAISGTGVVEQNGTGVTTLTGNNSFAGPVVVTQGTLRPGGATALGTAESATTVNSGATLDVNGQNITGEPVVVSGDGVGGNGAIVNSGADQTSALRDVTLTGDVTFGGLNRWDIRNTGGAARLNTGGNAFKLTKRGPDAVSLVSASVDSALGDVEVVEGTLRLQDATTGLGDLFNVLTVHGGATLAFFNLNPNPLQKQILLQDGATISHESGRSLLDSAISLDGSNTFNVASGGTNPSLVLSNITEGAGTLIKTGAGPLVLAAAARHTGPTYVNAGTMLVDIAVEFSEVTVNGGTLGGGGSIFTPVLVSTNGRLAPGALQAIGTMIFENQLTLRGTTAMDVSKASGAISSDAVQGFPMISYGGTLQLTLTGEPLADGDEIHLFTFAGASGAFASIVPATPGAGLAWDTSTLTTDGTLRVVAPVTFEFGSVSVDGSDAVFVGGGGPANAEYRVLTSTDLTVPVINWSPVTTNLFDASGNFNFRLPIEPATPQRFFILSY